MNIPEDIGKRYPGDQIRFAENEPSALALRLEFERLYQTGDQKFFYDLHRLLQAGANEAVRPWQETFTDVMMRSNNPLMVFEGGSVTITPEQEAAQRALDLAAEKERTFCLGVIGVLMERRSGRDISGGTKSNEWLALKEAADLIRARTPRK